MHYALNVAGLDGLTKHVVLGYLRLRIEGVAWVIVTPDKRARSDMSLGLTGTS